MEEQWQEMLDLLRYNKCFPNPEDWVKYGINHNFKRVKSEKLERCPDCSSRIFKPFGQYIYYSTLLKLQNCTNCGLVFSDTRIDPIVIKSHFEQTYKNDTYFLYRRRRIFEQISTLVDRLAPLEAKILDIGGAKGHLLSILKLSRPDLEVWLNDLSKIACDYAASEYGFKTIPGGISDISALNNRFDLIIMSDVIYYEPEIHKLWAVLPKLLTQNGSVIIRVPNRLAIISLCQLLFKTFSSDKLKKNQDRISFFNPEHLYIFSSQYLQKRLKGLGFTSVTTLPSELLSIDRTDLRHSLYYCLCKILWHFTAGNLIASPSVLIVAQNFSIPDKASATESDKIPNHEELVNV